MQLSKYILFKKEKGKGRDQELPCQQTGFRDSMRAEARTEKVTQRGNGATKATRQTTCCPGASGY